MMYCDKSLLEQIKGQTDNRSSFVIKEILYAEGKMTL